MPPYAISIAIARIWQCIASEPGPVFCSKSHGPPTLNSHERTQLRILVNISGSSAGEARQRSTIGKKTW